MRRVFAALIEAAERADVLTKPGNTRLRELERALRVWLRLRLPSSGEELQASRARLVAELRVFLETYPQGT